MKIDRLIGILSILLQEEKVTAPELAKRFEVSRRTINRDIESLCNAGIPIRTAQGVGGGICIMDGYRLDRTILTSKDMQMILAGLRSLDSIGGSQYYSQLMEKIKAGSTDLLSGSESILIDLSSWYKDSLSGKIELIQKAIEERHVITFEYYSPSGNGARSLEPYYVIFKWSSWYVWGWCRTRQDFRMFKLNRMTHLMETVEKRQEREVPMPDLSNERIFPGKLHVRAMFEASMKWHLIEEFGADSFEEQPDGRLLFEQEYSDQDSLVTWMLTCKDQVEILEPKEVRQELLDIAVGIQKKYANGRNENNEKMV